MAQGNFTVEGRTFRTQYDYMAGCRDKKKIDKLRQKVDFSNREALLKLQESLVGKTVAFETLVGEDFIEEVNEALMRTKQKSMEVPKEEVLKALRKKERNRKLFLTLVTLVAVCSLGYFAYYTYFLEKNGIDTTQLSDLKNDTRFASVEVTAGTGTVQKPVLDKYKTLYQVNKNLIGWVKIADTTIDYPVMQCGDEEFYLNHDFENKKDRNGSIFMDPKCDAMTPSTNLIVYGHNMKSGKMFGTLSSYEDENFYREHKEFTFDTIYEEGTYEVMYAFRSRVYEETEITFKYYQFIDAVSEEEFDSNMRDMAQMSLYDTGVTAAYGDRILTLSTCDYNEKNGRFVVVAKRVEE